MELQAVISALAALNAKCNIKIYTTSQYLIVPFIKGWITRWRGTSISGMSGSSSFSGISGNVSSFSIFFNSSFSVLEVSLTSSLCSFFSSFLVFNSACFLVSSISRNGYKWRNL